MEWVETTGKTVEEAKEAALDELGVDESDAEFEVVSEPKTGLFGRLRAEARVRARVRPSTPRSKESTSRRKRRPTKERPQRTPRTSAAPRPSSGSSEEDAEPAAQGQVRPKKSRNANSRRRTKPAAHDEGASTMEDEVALAKQGEVAKDFLNGLLGELDAPADIRVSVQEEDDIVLVAVDADDLGHLIGPRGATLHALQELTRTVVQRKTGARNGRIIVDIAAYREKRREALERFTRQIADEVISSNSQRALEPMNPADRKTVHDVANSIEGVSTTSEGEEPRRRVVIKPGGSA